MRLKAFSSGHFFPQVSCRKPNKDALQVLVTSRLKESFHTEEHEYRIYSYWVCIGGRVLNF